MSRLRNPVPALAEMIADCNSIRHSRLPQDSARQRAVHRSWPQIAHVSRCCGCAFLHIRFAALLRHGRLQYFLKPPEPLPTIGTGNSPPHTVHTTMRTGTHPDLSRSRHRVEQYSLFGAPARNTRLQLRSAQIRMCLSTVQLSRKPLRERLQLHRPPQ